MVFSFNNFVAFNSLLQEMSYIIYLRPDFTPVHIYKGEASKGLTPQAGDFLLY